MVIKTLEELNKEDESALAIADKQVEETTRGILSILDEIRAICQKNKTTGN